MAEVYTGPRSSIGFILEYIKSFIKGIPQMIKSTIIMAVISSAVTLGAHFYMLFVLNDGFNQDGLRWFNYVLNYASNSPTAQVYIFWFLANYLFWWAIGNIRNQGIGGTIKQLASTPAFIGRSVKESGLGSFPMIMLGLALAFGLRLFVLQSSTTLQMLLMVLFMLISQEESLTLRFLQLFIKDVSSVFNRGSEAEIPGPELPATAAFGSLIGFAYLVYFPFNPFMVQVMLGLAVIGIIATVVRSRGNKSKDMIMTALVLLCIFSVFTLPIFADDGGRTEIGWGGLVSQPGLRNQLIEAGIPAAIAGIAGSFIASGQMTKKIFDQLKKGKLKVTSDMSIKEMQVVQKIRTKVLTNLQRIEREVLFGKANKLWKADGEKGNILEHTKKLIDGILENGEVDLNHLDKVHTVYTHHITGRTITEDMIPSDAQLNAEILNNTLKWSGEALIRGRDQDGTISWIGMGTRIVAGIASGGTTELFYAPAGALYTMKDYVDAGEDNGYVIFSKAVALVLWEEMVIGNSIQFGVGKVGRYVGEFGEYMAKEFPDMAGKVKNIINQADDILHKDITDLLPSNGKPGLPRGSQTKTPKELFDDWSRYKNSGQKAPGLDDFKIGQKGPSGEIELDWDKMKPIDGPPPLPYRDAKGIQEVADMNKAITVIRKTNPDSIDLINKKLVNPKPMDIKAKSVNAEDALLGFDDTIHFNGRGTNKGLVMCKKPKLPNNFDDLPRIQKQKVMDRYWQRMDEFENLGPELQKMVKDGKIEWDPDTGVIKNAKNNKPLGGDNDVFANMDADTVNPLNPLRTKTMNQQLQTNGNTVHNDHIGMQYGQYEGSNPSKFNQYKNIDEGILSGHKDGGLIAYNSKTGKWYEVVYDGSTSRNWSLWEGGSTQ